MASCRSIPMNGTITIRPAPASRKSKARHSPPPLEPNPNRPGADSASWYSLLLRSTSSARHGTNQPGSTPKSPSPPLVTPRKEKYESGKSLGVAARNVAISAFPAGLANRQTPPRLPKVGTASKVSSNDEVERRAGAPTINETALSQSSTPSLAHRSHYPRSLEPFVSG